MKPFYLFIINCLLVTGVSAQTVKSRLQTAFGQFEADPQLESAISSLYVVNAATGEVVFDKNSRIGLAPASTQKIVTAASAFELLGSGFRYATRFIMARELRQGTPWLYVQGSGDPAFGSARFAATREGPILENVRRSLSGWSVPPVILIPDVGFGTASVPDGYIWQDIGNYYGAGHYQLNWKENRYDVLLNSEEEKKLTSIAGITLDTAGYHIYNEVISGKPGSGDNAYIYGPPYGNRIIIRGTIPPNQKSFSIFPGRSPIHRLHLGKR